MSRETSFWVFMATLILLHLLLRLTFGLTMVPDLLVIAALLGARRLNGGPAAAWGLVLGIIADSLALVAFGATAVALVIVCHLGSRTRNLFEGESFLFTFVYVFFGAWLVEAIRFLVGGAMRRGDAPIMLVTDLPLAALVTAAGAFFALLAYRAITGHR